ncbi:aminoglycoside phosphotransferase family protein [Streptomyces oryzae]|uniref:Aminoglycoside phosphotransferase family protein n=1 Tax=Streptomyces oryzae TaxID=1434886 RepID=A0ABS3X5U5_9ACTN|nr:aminoglycoside phosphotransferase family protein [Streptomyces oryzae]MBO8190748.1 aminoglycoside phosphotransferase family protein [Streptomyces oryzae]
MPLPDRPAGDPALHRALAVLAGDPAGNGEVVAERADATVVRVGDRVAKAHAPDAEAAPLDVRVRVAAAATYRGVLLPPASSSGTVPLPGGRAGSVWPYGAPVDPDDAAAAPWEAAGELLARLHTAPLPPLAQLPGPLPPMRGPAKALRALTRMRTAPPGAHAAAADAVERAWAVLPPWCRDEERPPEARILCHGDFHLGQLVRHPPPDGPWHLIDVDDLGLGDPAWDLARPACWYAAGLLPPTAWDRFFAAYARTLRTAGAPRASSTLRGLAGPDPWRYLDAPARALTVQSAALGVAKARTEGRSLDEAEEACVAACARIADLFERTERAGRTELPAPQAP